MLDKNENAPYVETKKDKSFSYKVGEACFLLSILCVASIIVALTVKLVMWILGL